MNTLTTNKIPDTILPEAQKVLQKLIEDFDPDAMVQNFVVGMLGYHTSDALTNDEWALPDPIPEPWN